MTHHDLHMAVRLLLRGTPYHGFTVQVLSHELHPGRVTIEYTVQITGIDRLFRSADPKRALSWVRQTLKTVEVDEVPPPALRTLGSVAQLRRVK